MTHSPVGQVHLPLLQVPLPHCVPQQHTELASSLVVGDVSTHASEAGHQSWPAGHWHVMALASHVMVPLHSSTQPASGQQAVPWAVEFAGMGVRQLLWALQKVCPAVGIDGAGTTGALQPVRLAAPANSSPACCPC